MKRVICVGLGPIGLETCRLIQGTPGLRLAGVVDKDPGKAGREFFGLRALADMQAVLRKVRPGIAFLTTASRFPQVIPDIKTLVTAGVQVVSSCEELSFPWLRYKREAGALDAFVRAHDGRVLGTGVNPGFVMDFLPVALSTVCQKVGTVHVRRTVDVSRRRLQLQKKMAVGLSVAEFRDLVKADAIGHVGLKESVALIADALGWDVNITETIAPITAAAALRTKYFKVQRGQVIGIAQTATGARKGKPVIVLDLAMSLGAKDATDEVHIAGVPPVHLKITPGIQGDLATAACLVKGASRLDGARRGLLTVNDLLVC